MIIGLSSGQCHLVLPEMALSMVQARTIMAAIQIILGGIIMRTQRVSLAVVASVLLAACQGTSLSEAPSSEVPSSPTAQPAEAEATHTLETDAALLPT
jgi:predicted lipid-binding transport protein (Tim44 family)